MAEKKEESRRKELLKALVYGVAALIVYLLVFSNSDYVLEILFSKSWQAPLLSITLVLLVSFLYGSCTSKFFKHTLEKALESQTLREE